jgi:hypothetical protein
MIIIIDIKNLPFVLDPRGTYTKYYYYYYYYSQYGNIQKSKYQ